MASQVWGDEKQERLREHEKLESSPPDVRKVIEEAPAQVPTAEGAVEPAWIAPAEVVADVQSPEPERSEASPTKEFEVVVSRSSLDKRVGLDTIVRPPFLVVSAVRPGIIEEWNAAHPERVVMPGDAIKAVNGESSDIVRMYAHMAGTRRLRIQIQRG